VAWVDKIQQPVVEEKPTRLRRHSRIRGGIWNSFQSETARPSEFQEADLNKHVFLDDRFKRTYETAGFFTERITEALRTEDDRPDLWFIHRAEDVYKYCRPAQSVDKEHRIEAEGTMKPSEAHRLQKQPALFGAWNKRRCLTNMTRISETRSRDACCHRKFLLRSFGKARWHIEVLNKAGKPTRQLDKLQSEIAWNLGSAIYYKVGGRRGIKR